jgi:membrane-associated phospholipid phosphatase
VRHLALLLALFLAVQPAAAQRADSTSRGDRTFLTRRDLWLGAAALGGTALLSIWDDDIALASQGARYQGEGTDRFANRASKVQETTLTVAGLVTYGIGRLTRSNDVAEIALHATESVVLASLASQLIRGPLGRTRPNVAGDTNQYLFRPFKGFGNFANRAYPSIHTSSSMAVATALTMESHRRNPRATKFVAPVLFGAGILPGLSRIQLDQHWASDIAAGAFMGVLAGYKVVKYSHDHPDNKFDRVLLGTSVTTGPQGELRLGFSAF